MTELTVTLPVHLAIIESEGIEVTEGPSAFEALEACAEAVRRRAAEARAASPGAIAGVEHARALFRALAIDPTKRRPSSEALLKRALEGGPMPRVNTLVDAGNWCSLDFLLPLGIYDRAAVRGPIVLRRGGEGESYAAISGRDLDLCGRYLLADADGPFGAPMTDSLRTSVSCATRDSIVILYAPEPYDTRRLAREAAELASRIEAHCGGATARVEVVSGALAES